MGKKNIFLCAAVLLFFTAIAAAADMDYPKRIISLGPSITENLYLLGAEDKLIGTTTYCVRPSQARQKEKVGTILEINSEKIISLEPDLVIATPLTNQKTVDNLKDSGINVFKFSRSMNFAQICGQFKELAALVGKERLAEEIIAEAQKKVEFIRQESKDLGQVKVFVQVGIKPLFTVTADSFLNDFIELSGGVNIAKDARIGIYSREEVIRKNPDVIIIVTMGIAAEKEKQAWGKYKTLSAAKTGRIHIVDQYEFCSPTPLSFIESLEEVFRILHPDSKR